jgi:uncharacterized membrane protein
MELFGAVFVALTMHMQWEVGDAMLALPYIGFLAIGASVIHTMGLADLGQKQAAKATQFLFADNETSMRISINQREISAMISLT